MNILRSEELLQEAREQSAGLENFGDEDFRAPLDLLLHSLNEEAGLHEQGQDMMRQRLVGLLLNRLRIEDYFQRHPEIREETIRAPVFIAALPRSGTTMLHRFIASDPRMYAVLWYECRNPAPLPGSDSATKDPRIVSAEEEVRMMLQTYPGLDAIHPMDPVGPDEDIMLMEHGFCSGMPQSMANVPSYNNWEMQQADYLPVYRYLRKLLQFLQWQKKARGERGERWILKAPEHLGHLEALFEVFPDAVLVQSHRDPLQTIPSIASFVYSGWVAYAENPDKHAAGRFWCARFREFLHRCMKARQEMPGERFLDVWYRDALQDPFGVAEKVYAHAGMSINEEAQQVMEEWRERNRRENRAAHEYSLEEYGFSDEQIRSEFAEYRRRYIEE